MKLLFVWRIARMYGASRLGALYVVIKYVFYSYIGRKP